MASIISESKAPADLILVLRFEYTDLYVVIFVICAFYYILIMTYYFWWSFLNMLKFDYKAISVSIYKLGIWF